MVGRAPRGGTKGALADVVCPACGAPMRIDVRAPFATCPYCHVQSRIQRVASEAELARPGAEGVIRVVVADGLGAVLRAVGVAALLAVVTLAALTVNYFIDRARPGVGADAVFAVKLRDSIPEFENYSHVVVLRDGTVVVGSSTGRLAFVTPNGTLDGRLDLPLPAPRAELSGLAARPTGGFYASLGGAIMQISGPPFTVASVSPPLPLNPAERVYDAIAVDASGQLYAVTQQGDLVVVAPDGSASGRQATGIPTFEQRLHLGMLAFAPDGRVLLQARDKQMWWFDRAHANLIPLVHSSANPESSAALLPNGALIYDTEHALVRLVNGTPHPIKLARPNYLTFDQVVPDGQGGVVALSLSGTLARYDARRLAP